MICLCSTFSEIMVVCPEVHSRLLLLAPGTFITEWEDGAVACETFLKDEESYRAVADKLVQICYFYGFDGWLINIENTLSVSHILLAVAMVKYKHSIFPVSNPCYPSCSVWDKSLHASISWHHHSGLSMCAPCTSHLCVRFQEIAVQNTPLFLRYLTDQMHQQDSGSLVLWYDSVTENGQLQWQNELNPSNR